VKEQEIKAFPEAFKSYTTQPKKLIGFIEKIPQRTLAQQNATITERS